MTKRLVAVLLAAGALAASAETPQKARPESLQRWQDMRFGLFIHWGPVSLTEKEISWSRANSNPKCPNRGPTPVAVYDNLYRKFNPTNFNSKEWVAIAKAAGMKYMVLTVKHCDGFLLWDSKVDDYNIMHTPFQRDVAAELAAAAHEAGMGLGWYYSPMDWRDPDCRNEKNGEFVQRMQAELTELLSNYGQIDVLWFDCDGGSYPWDQENTYALVRRLQPGLVIDNRLDPGNPHSHIGPWADYYTPEQFVGGFDIEHPWESCMTVSRRNQWAWGGHADGVKALDQCLNMLIRCAGGDGNMLLNVGPTATGEIAPEQASLIKGMGSWLEKHGESIYGTRGGPFKPGKYGVSTHKGNTIYVHVQRWTGETLTLPALPARITGSRALTGGGVTVRQSGEGIEVALPPADRDALDTVIALELDRPAAELKPVEVRLKSASLAGGKPATASNVFQGQAGYGADKAFDDDSETRWATDSGTRAAWLEVDLGAPQAFRRAVIEQAYPELKRVRKFAIETWQDGKWTACFEGGEMGGRVDVMFPPVTAQRVRLNITEATDGPTIEEFQLFAK